MLRNVGPQAWPEVREGALSGLERPRWAAFVPERVWERRPVNPTSRDDQKPRPHSPSFPQYQLQQCNIHISACASAKIKPSATPREPEMVTVHR